jgi:hypothetical protein
VGPRQSGGHRRVRRDGERGEIVDAAEAAQARDPGREGFERQQIAQFGIDRVQPGNGFVDGADVGPMRLLKRGQRPALRL